MSDLREHPEPQGSSGAPPIQWRPQDRPLRRDVRLLGQLLMEILAEEVSPALARQVEHLRRLCKALREGDLERAPELEAFIDRLPVTDALHLIRAFSLYFQLVNLAEERHRGRRRLQVRRSRPQGQPGSPEDLAARLKEAGVT
ncbi:MAG TPA: phosphoenolpyruvate carboxylase, partial [Limnochorda sp.]